MSGITYDVEATSTIFDRQQERTITDLQAAQRFFGMLGMWCVVKSNPAEGLLIFTAYDREPDAERGWSGSRETERPEGVTITGYDNIRFCGIFTVGGTMLKADLHSHVGFGNEDMSKLFWETIGYA